MTRCVTRRDAIALFGGLTAFTLAGCNSSNGGDKVYKIGVLQLTEHDALDAANKGFVKALKKSGLKYKIDQQNAQNDQSACQTIATKLVNDGDDLILAIATPAAQAVAGATSDIPIVGTAITDFAASGLVKSNKKPGNNVTGTSDLTPVDEQFDLLTKLLPNAKTVGVLYCTAESNSDVQVKMAQKAAKKRGLKAVRYSVSSSNEIQQVVESMVGKVDACYAPTDNTIAAGMSTVSMVANENKLPVICGEEGHGRQRRPRHVRHRLRGPGLQGRQDGRQDPEGNVQAGRHADRAPQHQGVHACDEREGRGRRGRGPLRPQGLAATPAPTAGARATSNAATGRKTGAPAGLGRGRAIEFGGSTCFYH